VGGGSWEGRLGEEGGGKHEALQTLRIEEDPGKGRRRSGLESGVADTGKTSQYDEGRGTEVPADRVIFAEAGPGGGGGARTTWTR